MKFVADENLDRQVVVTLKGPGSINGLTGANSKFKFKFKFKLGDRPRFI